MLIKNLSYKSLSFANRVMIIIQHIKINCKTLNCLMKGLSSYREKQIKEETNYYYNCCDSGNFCSFNGICSILYVKSSKSWNYGQCVFRK